MKKKQTSNKNNTEQIDTTTNQSIKNKLTLLNKRIVESNHIETHIRKLKIWNR